MNLKNINKILKKVTFQFTTITISQRIYNKALCNAVITSKDVGKREPTKQFDIYIVKTKRIYNLNL